MKTRRLLLVLLGLLVLLPAAGAARAQQLPAAAPQAPQEPAKGRISGTVVSAKTGEILKGVSLMLAGMVRNPTNPGPRLVRQATSGMDGAFVFEELPAAEYDLMARKVGYGSERFFGPQLRMRLGADEIRDEIVVRLQPSAVVTGRVLDAYGEPLPDAQVYAITRRMFPGREPHRMAIQTVRTNDLGEYRLHSLDAGKYVLAAGPPRSANPRGVGYNEFATSYYPTASSVEEATPIKLAAGAELNGVDFRLEFTPETTVRGIVTEQSTGKPCGECSLQFDRADVTGFMGINIRPTPEGVFVVHGLRGGESTVLVQPVGSRRTAPSVESFQVPRSGETEISLVVGGLQKVSGVFVVEGGPEEAQPPADGQTPPMPQPPQMFILESTGPIPYGGGRGTVPREGGPFELEDISSGDYKIRLFGPGGGYLRLVTLDGRELDRPRITVPDDGPLTGLKLHVAFGGASISGVVKPAAGEQTEEMRGEQVVILVPEDRNGYAQSTVTRVELDGTFTARGLMPAAYTLFVSPSFSVDFDDPDLRRALKPYSKQVTLKKGEQARIELTAIPDSAALR